MTSIGMMDRDHKKLFINCVVGLQIFGSHIRQLFAVLGTSPLTTPISANSPTGSPESRSSCPVPQEIP